MTPFGLIVWTNPAEIPGSGSTTSDLDSPRLLFLFATGQVGCQIFSSIPERISIHDPFNPLVTGTCAIAFCLTGIHHIVSY